MRLSGKMTTKPASLLNVGSKLVIESDWIRKTILVEKIAVKRVSFEKAKAFYKIIEEDSNKKLRRNLKALKEKLHFLSDN